MNQSETELQSNEQHVAIEIMAMMPRLRDGLTVRIQTYAGKTCYVIEDKIGSKFFRLGIAEYTFVSLLDGRTTIAEAMGETASIAGQDALSESETGALVKWLMDSGLTTTAQSTAAGRLSETADKMDRKRQVGKANPVMQKLPLFNPMRLLKRLDVFSEVLFSPAAIAIWCVVVLLGAYKFWINATEFGAASGGVFASSNWIWLAATWIGLKLIHETGHALACRKFSGDVREAGIVFILFAPMPYVDVTSVWRLDSKWQRILVSAAGMYAEMFVAAIAAIVWSITQDPLLQQHCVNVVIMASVVTVLFNANPLMRFDGYYMLADAIEMPNLATHGRQWVAYAARRYLLGMPVKCPQWPEGKHMIVVLYAITSFLWRIIITVSIALGAEVLFHGAGAVIALVALAMTIVPPVVRTARLIRDDNQVRYRRPSFVSALVVVTIGSSWAFVPWYSNVHVPIVVDYHQADEYRCGVGGFLIEQNARVGDTVSAGDVLARISNRELELEYENLRLDRQQSVQRARSFRADGSIAAAQVETRNRQAIDQRLAEMKQQLQSLTIIAAASGIVTHSDVETLQGTAMKAGDRLMTVGSDQREIIYGLVDQNTVDALTQRVGSTLEIHVWGSSKQTFSGKVRQVLPRATTQLKHVALGADVGGPLTVRPKTADSSTAGLSAGSPKMELVDPHFVVLVDFAGCTAEGVFPGQTGYAQLRFQNGTLGKAAWNGLSSWVESKRQLLSASQTCYQLCN